MEPAHDDSPGEIRDGRPSLEPRRQRLFHHAEEQARDLGIPLRHVDQLAWALALQGGL